MAQLIEMAPTVPPEIIEAAVSRFDKNDDGRVCIMELPDTPGIPSVVVNLIDNNASTP